MCASVWQRIISECNSLNLRSRLKLLFSYSSFMFLSLCLWQRCVIDSLARNAGQKIVSKKFRSEVPLRQRQQQVGRWVAANVVNAVKRASRKKMLTKCNILFRWTMPSTSCDKKCLGRDWNACETMRRVSFKNLAQLNFIQTFIQVGQATLNLASAKYFKWSEL